MTRKDDKGKLRYSLLPWNALREVVKIFEHGATKYGADNWKTVPDPKARYTDALIRHVAEYAEGHEKDTEGLLHLACIAANALILLAFRAMEEEKLKKTWRGYIVEAPCDLERGQLVVYKAENLTFSLNGKKYSGAYYGREYDES